MKRDDLISSSSANSRKEETEQILEEVFRNNPHLLSQGARKEIRKIKAGFVVLAIATVVGIWAFTARADRNLRQDIRKQQVRSCLSSIQIINKYNNLVQSIVETRQEALNAAIKENNKTQIKLNRQAVKRYKTDLISPPTTNQCKKAGIR
jgi:hypothetical protein